MNKKAQRVGGATKISGADNATAKWLAGGARNPEAGTPKQKADRQRVRAGYDIVPELKAAVAKGARTEQIDTSYTQFAEILLTWAMAQFIDGKLDHLFQERTPSNSLRFRYDYELPDVFEQVSRYGTVDGTVDGTV